MTGNKAVGHPGAAGKAGGGSGGNGGVANGGTGAPVLSGPGTHGGAGGSGGSGGLGQGGAVYGSVTATGSTFPGNIVRAGGGGAGGNGGGGGVGGPGSPGGPGGGGGRGGIASEAEGGGLFDNGGGDLVVNTTVAGNAVTGGRGGNGGIGGDGGSGPAGTGPTGPPGAGGSGARARGGGLEWDASGNLTDDTIDGNSATGGTFGLGNPVGTADSGSSGGGAFFGTTLANTIVAQNTVAGGSPTAPDCGVQVTSDGHNLIGAIDGCNGIVAGTNGDQAGTSVSPLDPLLAALANNGGPTPTMAEHPGSPAAGHGNPTTCTSTNVADKDQRGYPRLSTSRGACDAGAYDSAEPSRFAVSAPAGVTNRVSFSVTVTAVDPFGNKVMTFRDRFHFTSTDVAAVLPANYALTSADGGSHKFKVTLKTAGHQTLTEPSMASTNVAPIARGEPLDNPIPDQPDHERRRARSREQGKEHARRWPCLRRAGGDRVAARPDGRTGGPSHRTTAGTHEQAA